MRKIDITETTFYPIRPTDRGLIGFAACIFANKLALNSISVYTRPDGDIRLLFPEKILANGKRLNVFYPITREAYEVIRAAVKNKVEELTKKARIEENGKYS